MTLTHDPGTARFIFQGGYSEKEYPKAARFRWDPASKVWWTDDAERAAQLKDIADQEAAEAIDTALAQTEKARESSRATDAQIDIPAPPGLSYMPFQRAGIAYAMARPACLIGDEPGLGKTIQTAGIINSDPTVNRVLVICPASLKLNWQREMEKWMVRKRRIVIADTKISRSQADYADILIVNYDILTRLEWLSEIEWDMVVMDEAHAIRNQTAQRTKAAHQIRGRRRLLLTGTPIVNRPKELFSLIHYIDPAAWPKFMPFAMRYCLPPEAPILMSDFTERSICDIRIGDKVIGWGRSGEKIYRKTQNRAQRRLCEATVLDVLERDAPLQVVRLCDGTELKCTPDHRWLNGTGAGGNEDMEYYPARTGRMSGAGRGCASRMVRIFSPPKHIYIGHPDYERGYLLGLYRGDGYCSRTIQEKHSPFRGRTTRGIMGHKTGVGCMDVECIDRAAEYLTRFGVEFTRAIQSDGITRLLSSGQDAYEFFSSEQPDTDEWWAGFLGGIYDAEGSGQRIAQYLDRNANTHKMITVGLSRFGFDFRPERKVIRMIGGRKELLRFWSIAAPALTRKLKSYVMDGGGKFMTSTSPVESIFPMDGVHKVFTLTTTTGNYVAYGLGSKNCNGNRTRWGWDFSGASNLDELQDKLRATILVRRLKKDVLTELPPKRRQIIELAANGASPIVEREKAAWDAHQALTTRLRAQVELAKAGEDEGAYAAAVGRLREAMTVAFSEISKLRHETAVAKIPQVIAHIEETLESEGKVVVFGHHHDVIDAIADAFPGIAVKLDGRMGMPERQESVDRFQKDPAVRLFVGSIQAAGVGLTLTASSHVIFAELDWTPGNVSQAEDRCHRIGQQDNVLVQHLVLEDSLDCRMAKIIVQKQGIIDAALDDATSREILAMPILPIKPEEEPATASTTRQDLLKAGLSMTERQKAAIHAALRTLAGLDPDHAGEKNEMGFNRMDGEIGHSLAEAVSLTPRQAALGLKIIQKYKRQIGEDIVKEARGGR